MNISHYVYPQASEILRKRGNGRKIRSFKNENERTFKIARNKCLHAINLTCNVISVVCNVQFTWHMPICKDLRMKKWKSVTLSFNKALVNWFLNSIKKKVSYYGGLIWIYILLCLYVRKNDFDETNCQINIFSNINILKQQQQQNVFFLVIWYKLPFISIAAPLA